LLVLPKREPDDEVPRTPPLPYIGPRLGQYGRRRGKARPGLGQGAVVKPAMGEEAPQILRALGGDGAGEARRMDHLGSGALGCT